MRYSEKRMFTSSRGLLSALLVLLAVPIHATCATISGRISHIGDGEPIAGAAIDLWERSPAPRSVRTTSASDGSYSLEAAPQQTYDLFVSRSGYVMESRIITVAPDATTVPGQDVALSRPATIRGILRTGNPPAPHPGAVISAYAGIRRFASSAQSAPDGSYSIGGLSAQEYRVCILNPNDEFRDECWNDQPVPATGVIDALAPMAVSSGEIRTGIDFHLEAGGAISGVIRDRYLDAPAANRSIRFSLRLAQSSSPLSGVLKTDSDGRYTIKGLATADYFVEMGQFDYTTRIHPTSIARLRARTARPRRSVCSTVPSPPASISRFFRTGC